MECKSCGFWFTNPRPIGKELDHYYQTDDYISHTDQRKSLFDRAYHLVRSIAIRQKAKLVENINGRKGDLLDFGAGTGAFVLHMKEAGWSASGVEPDVKAREIGAKKGLRLYSNVDFDQDSQLYDIITLWHVLEHLPDLNEKIRQFFEKLKPGGALVIALPNHNSFDAKVYKDYWAALDIPLHLSHFRKEDIRNLTLKHNFRYQATYNMPFDAFYVSLLSEKNRPAKTNHLRALGVAALSNLKGARNANMSSLIHVLKKGEEG